MDYIDRRGTDSLKWDGLKKTFGEEGLLPLWVADMDFPSPDCVVEALQKYISLPLGYYKTPDSYFEAVMDWERERQGYAVEREWICSTPGVVPSLYWAVRVFTKPGEAVMISTPVYYPFMGAVNGGGRRLVCSNLKKVGCRYEYDLERFERDIVENEVKLYILCNPHNPVGRVWTAEELCAVLGICRRHGVMVISDEIHQDIVSPSLGRAKVTAATLKDFGDMVITLASLGKTFNIAAAQNSFTIIPDRAMRESFESYLQSRSLDSVSGFGLVASEAAMRKGGKWLGEILKIIYGNYEYIKDRLAVECPKLALSELEGTYLLWMDFGRFVSSQSELKELLQDRCRLALDYGQWFGGDSDCFARMNLATSRENIETACDRIVAALKEQA